MKSLGAKPVPRAEIGDTLFMQDCDPAVLVASPYLGYEFKFTGEVGKVAHFNLESVPGSLESDGFIVRWAVEVRWLGDDDGDYETGFVVQKGKSR